MENKERKRKEKKENGFLSNKLIFGASVDKANAAIVSMIKLTHNN